MALLLFGSVLYPAAARGQDEGFLIYDLPTSAAAAGLGDAHPLFGASDNAVFAHPALLAQGSGFGVFLADLGIDTRHFGASASGAWWGGGVGIGMQTLSMSAQGLRRHVPSGLVTLDVTPPPTNATQSVVAVGYAREFFGSVNIGVVGKLFEFRAESFDDRMAALDVGASTEVGPVAVALSFQGLGPLFEDGSLSGDPRVSLGAATRRRPVGPVDLAVAAALVRDGNGTFVPGGGVEASWWPITGRRFIARVGLQRTSDFDPEQAFTAGAGFEGDDIALEYAYQALRDDLGSVHRFGVRWR